MLDPKFVILGASLNLVGSLSYVVATLRGQTKPNRVTWFLWALAPLIAFSAEINEGVGLQALMTFMVGFGPLMIFLASFVNRQSTWELTKFDFVCGGLSVIGLVLWLIVDNANIAILFSIVADALAGLPTIRKSYKAPHTESIYVFILASVSAVITLLTIDNWTFAHWAFPAYIFVICTVTAALILLSPNRVTNKSSSDILPA